MRHDIVAEVTLKSSREGGRASAISLQVGAHYGCPLCVDGKYFESRFDLETSGKIELETPTIVPIAFLSPEISLPYFAPGVTFELWEGKTIGVGKVVSVASAANNSLQARRP